MTTTVELLFAGWSVPFVRMHAVSVDQGRKCFPCRPSKAVVPQVLASPVGGLARILNAFVQHSPKRTDGWSLLCASQECYPAPCASGQTKGGGDHQTPEVLYIGRTRVSQKSKKIWTGDKHDHATYTRLYGDFPRVWARWAPQHVCSPSVLPESPIMRVQGRKSGVRLDIVRKKELR